MSEATLHRLDVSHTWDVYIDKELYRLVITDERPEMDLDPTLCVYRSKTGFTADMQDEPVAIVHLDARAACYDPEHLTAKESE